MNRKLLNSLALSVFGSALSSSVSATVFFETGFETGQPPANTPMPIWSLPPVWSSTYGANDFFFVSDVTASSGGHSLRIWYEGRNGSCNTCGTVTKRHASGVADNSKFVTDDGVNLTDEDEGAARPGKIVFNTSQGFSKWRITTVGATNSSNDTLNVTLLKEGMNGENGDFSPGDKVQIARTCGVDGRIGLRNNQFDIDRRKDCNEVITWLVDITEQPEGSSIFRRQYLKQEMTAPMPVHQKLHYFRPNRDSTKGSIRGETVLLGKSEAALADLGHPYPQVGLRHYGGKNVYRPREGMPEVVFERGKWYYVEEEYKASTFNPGTGEYNADGEYRLWFQEASVASLATPPILEETGLTLPGLSGGNGTHISLWGNYQHWTHDAGFWFMDDVRIADDRGGPVGGAPSIPGTAPPDAPTP